MRFLFVCTGNICRSPTAEGVAAHRFAGAQLDWDADSAGMGSWHVGEGPDERSAEAAARRGYDLSGQRARQVEPADFHRFDHIIALDNGHLRQLRRMQPADGRARLSLMLDWVAGRAGDDVPDPYYGAGDGFEHVLDLVEAAVDGLVRELQTSG